MKTYETKEAFKNELIKRAFLFVSEFDDIAESERNLLKGGVDRSPAQMLAYQLGWMDLLLGWERDEQNGIKVTTPAPGFQWNKLGRLYETFYRQWEGSSIQQLQAEFTQRVTAIIGLVDSFTDQAFFESGHRQWASSTKSAWPVYKWVHINTVAPFTTFRTKIRKWKRG
ncbi:ClbS/DfsB family four-helix bundle protein [Advenella sp. FME57]|uniref:Cytoplasmic protein n=1 Tax=Advenella kashmirensis TaxID=310575 RepID=A0A356LB53_9BURK|nr:cytoplasmic protein [Advenella kashmirensis]